MREPKRLAHRQAERNKARALKQWKWEDGDDESAAVLSAAREPATEPAPADAASAPDPRSFQGHIP